MTSSHSNPELWPSPGPTGPPPEPPLDPLHQQHLDQLLGDLQGLAHELSGNPAALLCLLRQIEQVHRRIQDETFRSSLPADRNQLFNLLQQIERSGGWPYIPRLQLRTFMELLQPPQPQSQPPLAA